MPGPTPWIVKWQTRPDCMLPVQLVVAVFSWSSTINASEERDILFDPVLLIDTTFS